MLRNALYYPYIDFRDSDWVKAVAMFYEKIYRIVPNNIIPNDPEELSPLLEDDSIGAMIDPALYAQDTAGLFLDKKDQWSAAALSSTETEENKISRLHTAKTDKKVRELFQSLGYKETEEWLHIPTELASNYMLFMATEIGKKNQLNLITSEWAPWTATSYFNLDGGVDEFIVPVGDGQTYIDDPFALFCLIVSETTPLNIEEIPAQRIVDFRVKRKDEVSNFRNAMLGLYQELRKLEDPKVRYDAIMGKIEEMKKAKREYQKSADIIKAKGWFGVSFMGFPAPIALCSLFSIPVASTVTLTVGSLAIGGIFNIKNTRQEIRKLQKESPASFLFEMSKSFKGYTSFRGGGDINYKAFNCMEEYVND